MEDEILTFKLMTENHVAGLINSNIEYLDMTIYALATHSASSEETLKNIPPEYNVENSNEIIPQI